MVNPAAHNDGIGKVRVRLFSLFRPQKNWSVRKTFSPPPPKLFESVNRLDDIKPELFPEEIEVCPFVRFTCLVEQFTGGLLPHEPELLFYLFLMFFERY